jgi:hypothetical protein
MVGRSEERKLTPFRSASQRGAPLAIGKLTPLAVNKLIGAIHPSQR